MDIMNKLSQLHRNLIALAALALMIMPSEADAQSQPVDTVYNPPVLFNGMPRNYEIADIKVEGADNYEDHIVIGFSGLKAGERIDIPGDEITQASKRLWRQGLFSKGMAHSSPARAAPDFAHRLPGRQEG